jgi:hypothetical protein
MCVHVTGNRKAFFFCVWNSVLLFIQMFCEILSCCSSRCFVKNSLVVHPDVLWNSVFLCIQTICEILSFCASRRFVKFSLFVHPDVLWNSVFLCIQIPVCVTHLCNVTTVNAVKWGHLGPVKIVPNSEVSSLTGLFALKMPVWDQRRCPYFIGCHFTGLLFTGFTVPCVLPVLCLYVELGMWVSRWVQGRVGRSGWAVSVYSTCTVNVCHTKDM